MKKESKIIKCECCERIQAKEAMDVISFKLNNYLWNLTNKDSSNYFFEGFIKRLSVNSSKYKMWLLLKDDNKQRDEWEYFLSIEIEKKIEMLIELMDFYDKDVDERIDLLESRERKLCEKRDSFEKYKESEMMELASYDEDRMKAMTEFDKEKVRSLKAMTRMFNEKNDKTYKEGLDRAIYKMEEMLNFGVFKEEHRSNFDKNLKELKILNNQ